MPGVKCVAPLELLSRSRAGEGSEYLDIGERNSVSDPASEGSGLTQSSTFVLLPTTSAGVCPAETFSSPPPPPSPTPFFLLAIDLACRSSLSRSPSILEVCSDLDDECCTDSAKDLVLKAKPAAPWEVGVFESSYAREIVFWPLGCSAAALSLASLADISFSSPFRS